MNDNNMDITDDENNSNNDTSSKEKNKGTGINFTRFLEQYRVNGDIDLDAAFAAAREEAIAYLESTEITVDILEGAVRAAFAKKKTDTLRMNSLLERAVLEIDCSVEHETRVAKRIQDFVQAQSKLFNSTDGVEGNFCIRKGRNAAGSSGGVHLVTDAYRADYKNKLAADIAVAALKNRK